MSSTVYEAELAPDDRIRAGLLAFACAATLTGLLLICLLPAIAALKLALVSLWLLAGVAEIAAFRRGMARIYRIRIRSDGRLLAVDRAGALSPLTLLPGSVVLERLAWLRVKFEDGLRCGELLAGSAAENEQWRRLLVIWRQRRLFGGTSGSC
ncbi:MAG TPA: hypothetical protein VFG91_04130 [Woeseiaceae bacterium]|nr:hypothetical protein [Woeseiaceae bacterium]